MDYLLWANWIAPKSERFLKNVVRVIGRKRQAYFKYHDELLLAGETTMQSTSSGVNALLRFYFIALQSF